jgi:hypothetical protein
MDEKCRNCPLVAEVKKELERLRNSGRAVFAWSAVWDVLKKFWLASVVILAMMACTTTRYVEVERVRTDTLLQTQVVRDSVCLYDSIHVKERGDTVWVEKWHTLTQWKERHDTVYQATHDTIPKPYHVEKKVEVEKPLTWWLRFRLFFGDLALIVGGVVLFFWSLKTILMKVVRP